VKLAPVEQNGGGYVALKCRITSETSRLSEETMVAVGIYNMGGGAIVDCGRSSSVGFPEMEVDYDIRPIHKEFLRPWCRLNQYKKVYRPYALSVR